MASFLCGLISNLAASLRGQDDSEKLCQLGQIGTKLGATFNPQGGSNDENYDIVLNESMMMDDNGATFAGRIGITTPWC